MIIFCKRYEECSRMYWVFKKALKGGFTQPNGAPDLAQFRVVDMYTKCIEMTVKKIHYFIILHTVESIMSGYCNHNIWYGLGLLICETSNSLGTFRQH